MTDNKASEPVFRQSAYTAMNTTTSEMPLLAAKTQMQNTGSSWFMEKRTKPDSNNRNLEQLTIDQLRERLLIAETIMKRQYARNKELEKQIEDV